MTTEAKISSPLKGRHDSTFHRRIGRNLRQLREKKNYTQEFVGEVLGKSYNAYGKTETGQVRLSLEEAAILSELYEISINELLNPTYEWKAKPPETEPRYILKNTVEMLVKLDGNEGSLRKQIDLLYSINKVLAGEENK